MFIRGTTIGAALAGLVSLFLGHYEYAIFCLIVGVLIRWVQEDLEDIHADAEASR